MPVLSSLSGHEVTDIAQAAVGPRGWRNTRGFWPCHRLRRRSSAAARAGARTRAARGEPQMVLTRACAVGLTNGGLVDIEPAEGASVLAYYPGVRVQARPFAKLLARLAREARNSTTAGSHRTSRPIPPHVKTCANCFPVWTLRERMLKVLCSAYKGQGWKSQVSFFATR